MLHMHTSITIEHASHILVEVQDAWRAQCDRRKERSREHHDSFAAATGWLYADAKIVNNRAANTVRDGFVYGSELSAWTEHTLPLQPCFFFENKSRRKKRQCMDGASFNLMSISNRAKSVDPLRGNGQTRRGTGRACQTVLLLFPPTSLAIHRKDTTASAGTRAIDQAALQTHLCVATPSPWQLGPPTDSCSRKHNTPHSGD